MHRGKAGKIGHKNLHPTHGDSNSSAVWNHGKRGKEHKIEEGNVYFGDYLPYCDLSLGCVSLDAEHYVDGNGDA